MADEPNTSGPPAGAPETPREAQAQQLKKWIDEVAKFWAEHFKTLKNRREFARGTLSDDGGKGLVRVNLAHATIKGLMPHVYARNPELAVTPAEGVGQSEVKAVKAFSKTLVATLNEQFRAAESKKVAKAVTRGVLTSGLNWAKVTYQRHYESDPIIANRLEDSQDQIARLDTEIRQLEEEGRSPDELAARREGIEDLMAGLKRELEVVVAEGLTLDRVQPEHLLLDPVIATLDDYKRSRRITQIIYMPKSKGRERFRHKLEHAKEYPWASGGPDFVDDSNTRNDRGGLGKTIDPLIKAYETWDMDRSTVYTQVEGEKDFVKEPWQPEFIGRRFYPYFGLWFDETDGFIWPMALKELIEELVDEYNASRTQQAEHRGISLPHWVADKSTDRDTLERYSDPALGEVVLVDANGRPLNQVIQAATPPQYNPQIYDTTQIRGDIDTMTGQPETDRGALLTQKTATEAQILTQGLAGRAAEVQDRIEDWYGEMGEYAAELLLQELSPQQVQRIAGPDAVWPQMDLADVFEKVSIQIRAGTSGKPNRAVEQERWAKLMPQLAQIQDQIIAMMAQGIDPTPKVAVMRETLRRFDENLDLEEFLPPGALNFREMQAAGAGGAPGIPLAAAPGGAGPGGPGQVLPFAPPAASA